MRMPSTMNIMVHLIDFVTWRSCQLVDKRVEYLSSTLHYTACTVFRAHSVDEKDLPELNLPSRKVERRRHQDGASRTAVKFSFG